MAFKRMLSGVLLRMAEVIPFPTGDELEERKKRAMDPERRQAQRARDVKRRERKERAEKNKRITDSLKD